MALPACTPSQPDLSEPEVVGLLLVPATEWMVIEDVEVYESGAVVAAPSVDQFGRP